MNRLNNIRNDFSSVLMDGLTPGFEANKFAKATEPVIPGTPSGALSPYDAVNLSYELELALARQNQLFQQQSAREAMNFEKLKIS